MWLFSKRIPVRESGMLEGFRDCHCHLLPGVDDGVKRMDDTMHILEEWERCGVKEVWMTPHIMEDIPNEPDALRERFKDVKASYTGGIKLQLAAEHMMDGLFLRRLEKEKVMTLNVERGTLNENDNGNDNGNGKVDVDVNVDVSRRLLVETSYYTPPMNMAELIERVKRKGYEPILAHPERYQYMDRNDYLRWKQHGVLLQLNVPSLVGAYGPEVQRKAEWLLKENMYDYCGTDTHSVEQVRMFLNSEISPKIVKLVSRVKNGE